MVNQQVQAVTIAGHDSDGSAGMPAGGPCRMGWQAEGEEKDRVAGTRGG